MKRTLLLILALFFPWITFLIVGKPISALAALALQLTFVGWLPASIWAWTDIKRAYPKEPAPLLTPAPISIDKTDNINQDIAEKQAGSATFEPVSEEKNNLNDGSKQP